MIDIREFLGIEPNDIQRRIYIAAFVFGATFILDIVLVISVGILDKGVSILGMFLNYYPPFSFERVVSFILILSVGVFVSLIYYILLPLGPPPRVESIPEMDFRF
ncbi:MAG: hypothetical protein J7K73_02970 [Nanoarchaeota archaeon]|nr:hypothetical protein [Nanoarchaeota archaeon]